MLLTKNIISIGIGGSYEGHKMLAGGEDVHRGKKFIFITISSVFHFSSLVQPSLF